MYQTGKPPATEHGITIALDGDGSVRTANGSIEKNPRKNVIAIFSANIGNMCSAITALARDFGRQFRSLCSDFLRPISGCPFGGHSSFSPYRSPASCSTGFSVRHSTASLNFHSQHHHSLSSLGLMLTIAGCYLSRYRRENLAASAGLAALTSIGIVLFTYSTSRFAHRQLLRQMALIR
jgi:hypothetical protein